MQWNLSALSTRGFTYRCPDSEHSVNICLFYVVSRYVLNILLCYICRHVKLFETIVRCIFSARYKWIEWILQMYEYLGIQWLIKGQGIFIPVQAMKAYGIWVSGSIAPAILNLHLGGEWSPSCAPPLLPLLSRGSTPNWLEGLMGPRATLETLKVHKSLTLLGNRISMLNGTQNLVPSVFQPTAQLLCHPCSCNEPSKAQNTEDLYEIE